MSPDRFAVTDLVLAASLGAILGGSLGFLIGERAPTRSEPIEVVCTPTPEALQLPLRRRPEPLTPAPKETTP